MALCMSRALAIQVRMKAAKRKMSFSIIHQKAVVEIITRSLIDRRPSSLAPSLSILSAIFWQVASLPCSSVRLAFALTEIVLASCREETVPSSLVRASESLFFEFSTLSRKNADGCIIVSQSVAHAVFLLHLFGCRKCSVYCRAIKSVLAHGFYRFRPLFGFLPITLSASRVQRRAHSRSSPSSRLP